MENDAHSSNKDTPSLGLLKLSHSHENPETKIVNYWDKLSGHCSRIKLDFDSPRTAEAADQLGIRYEDCIKKPKSEFFVPGEDTRIAELRYNHHCERVQWLLNELVKMRNIIIHSIASKKRDQTCNEKFYKRSMISTSAAFPEGRNSMINSNTIPNLFSPESQIGKAEKAEVKSFIEKAWKELTFLEKDKKHEKLRENRRMKLKSFVIKDTSQKKFVSDSQINTPRFPKVKPVRVDSKRDSLSSKQSSSMFFMTQPELSDLEKQTQIRKKGCIETLKKLREKEEIQQQKRELQQREWETIKARVERYEDRYNMAVNIVEMQNTNKKIIAAQSRGNAGKVQEIAKENMDKKLKEKEETYIAKAQKVEECKKKRDNYIKQTQERKKMESTKKKELLQESSNSSQIEKSNADMIVESIKVPSQKVISKARSESYDYYKDIQKITRELQQENKLRLDRIKEHKRSYILNMHKELQDTNRTRSNNLNTFQCRLRERTILNQQAKESALQMLQKVRMNNPYNDRQRDKLIESMKQLNSSFGLGLKLKLPKAI